MTAPVFSDQPYAGIASFGRAPFSKVAQGFDVAVVGIPYDSSVSYRSGTRFGPRAIREQSMLLWGYNNVQQVAPLKALRVADLGDINVVPPDIVATHREIERAAGAILADDALLISLGGDHSVTLPLLRAHAKKFGPLAVVHFDAHPDTWDSEYPEQRYSHGTGFRRALEEQLIDPSAYMQIGIRGPTNGPEDYEDAIRLGARMITFEEFHRVGIDAVLDETRSRMGTRATYVTLDIDAVDPAFAPGTGTPEVGGLSSYEMLRLVRGLRGLNLVGFDLVEVAPAYDPANITAILASNLVFEFLSLVALNRQPCA